ncbi:hypothetical protein SAMN04515620_1732 [Collimonas sp. OK607]|nr:hypothetical protein SAMN04515620_1732 [Collimonas sp. OK607]
MKAIALEFHGNIAVKLRKIEAIWSIQLVGAVKECSIKLDMSTPLLIIFTCVDCESQKMNFRSDIC